MHISELYIENFRLFGTGPDVLNLPLQAGLNVLVGENDAGKTAVIDAMRFALGTTSQDFLRVNDGDFHVAGGERAQEFRIRCKFTDIDKESGGALLEYLTYEDGKACLYVTFRATRNESLSARRRIWVDVRSGQDGAGPQLDYNARLLLQTTYLRPLRDAERELDAGRNSRLSQILQYTKEIAADADEEFEPAEFVAAVEAQEEAEFPRSVVNVSKLADHLIQENEGVKEARNRLDATYLAGLNLGDDPLSSRISVADRATEDQRLRAVLEKLELRLSTVGDVEGELPHGLGYNNLLFMACELLLLGQEQDTLPLLLIEEPEAHLHPQLQLRLVDFLQEQASMAEGRRVQVIITSHSPNLVSKVRLANLILMCAGKAYPMGAEHTLLSRTDYRFLERFLDVTKANLFFARGVMIVEGDAENLLLPTLARLLGRDFTRYGVSIVNVGSRGLRRYARIFRRRPLPNGTPAPSLPIRVACLADRDIMPDCAREVFGAADDDDEDGEAKKRGRGARFESDLPDDEAREKWRQGRCEDDGENVRTFVADHWTLEYDLARAGLRHSLTTAIALAAEEAREDKRKSHADDADGRATALTEAKESLKKVKEEAEGRSDAADYIACQICAPLMGGVSKAMTAQHLASNLEKRYGATATPANRAKLSKFIPAYIRDAIAYVTNTASGEDEGDGAIADPGNGPQ